MITPTSKFSLRQILPGNPKIESTNFSSLFKKSSPLVVCIPLHCKGEYFFHKTDQKKVRSINLCKKGKVWDKPTGTVFAQIKAPTT